MLQVFQVAVMLSVPATPNAAITPAFFVILNYRIPERSDEVEKASERGVFLTGLNLKMRFFFFQ